MPYPTMGADAMAREIFSKTCGSSVKCFRYLQESVQQEVIK